MSADANISTAEDQLRQANEEVYKHSLELAIRNKTLSLLRQLYQISILTLDAKALCEKITTTVREALEFELVSIMTYGGNDTLTPVATAQSERLLEAVAATGYPLGKQIIPKASTVSLMRSVFGGEAAHGEHLEDLWGSVIPQEQFKKIAAEGHVKTLSVHPLMIDKKLKGVLIFALNRPYDGLNTYERESIASLVDVVAIALDRAHVYEALEVANVKLTQANEQQVVLIHFITHQIKGFLTKSRNIFSMMLEGDYGTVPDTAKSAIQEGFNSDTVGVDTIQEILNAANIRSGKVTYAMAPVDFKALVEEVADGLKSSAEKKKLEFSITTEGDTFSLTGDRAQLTHVIKNLVDNSIRYTPKGQVKVSLKKAEGKILFTVADTGVGITPEDKTRLFTEGGHGKDSQKVNVESTGFGLYIVKNIVNAHGGTIRAESEGAGKGSTFIVTLPAS
jgi:signal transduction histidine kinase